jgi:hypothetical protein
MSPARSTSLIGLAAGVVVSAAIHLSILGLARPPAEIPPEDRTFEADVVIKAVRIHKKGKKAVASPLKALTLDSLPKSCPPI